MVKSKQYSLITGCAGFIGFHLCLFFLKKNKLILGIDNINNYYSTKIKKDRLKILISYKNFKFIKTDLSKKKQFYKSILNYKKKINCIFHLAAQAGVRYSIENPDAYISSNLIAFFNVISFAKDNRIKYMFYASSSSVYGDNTGKLSLNKNTSKPLSLYAATKKSNEVIAHAYSETHNITCIALRFFTVYGPYGRPDMSIFKFTKAISEKKTLQLYNNGNHFRDFTYIDDAVLLINSIYKKKSKLPKSCIFNISNGKKVKITKVINLIKNNLLVNNLSINKLPLQIGDIHTTLSDPSFTDKFTKISKRTSIEIGIKKFVKWYVEYFA